MPHYSPDPPSYHRGAALLSRLLYKWGDTALGVKYQVVGDGIRMRVSPQPQELPPCVLPQSEDGGRAKRALLHRPHYLSQAAQHGAEAHQTVLGRGPRANIPKFFWRKAGSRGRR